MTELAGYTHRVTDMLDVFEDVANGHYQRPNGDPSKEALLAQRGEKVLTDDGTIEFDSVPVVTPIGDVLVDELTLRLEVSRGQPLMVWIPPASRLCRRNARALPTIASPA